MTEWTPFIAINEGIIDRVLNQQQLTLFELFKLLELIKAKSTRRAPNREISDDVEFHAAFRHRR